MHWYQQRKQSQHKPHWHGDGISICASSGNSRGLRLHLSLCRHWSSHHKIIYLGENAKLWYLPLSSSAGRGCTSIWIDQVFHELQAQRLVEGKGIITKAKKKKKDIWTSTHTSFIAACGAVPSRPCLKYHNEVALIIQRSLHITHCLNTLEDVHIQKWDGEGINGANVGVSLRCICQSINVQYQFNSTTYTKKKNFNGQKSYQTSTAK